ncbi:glycosyltransferase [Desulfosarcina ovata]|nr:glycosyltransferase [Desulfosarcina ovata]
MPLAEPINQRPGWNYFDRVYCISLKDRADRRRQARRQFDAVGLNGRVTFVEVEKHPRNSEQGIYESHQRCIARGLAQGAGTILIFEDDVRFDGFTRQRLDQCIAFLASTADWQAFFFGCLVRRSHRTQNPAVLAVTYRALTHAYALSRPMATRIVTKPWQGAPYDAMLASFNRGFFAAYPAFAFQSDSASDNTRQLRLDRFRRRCGGLMRIQKANQWICRYRRLLIAVHVLGMAVIAGLALYFR